MGSVALHINSLIKLGQTIRDWERLQGVFNTVKGGMSSLGGAVTGLGTRVRATATAFLNLSRTLISSVISAVRTAVTSFANLAKEVLLSGLNALKSAGMWVIQKAQVLASAIANGIATASQWALNIAMSMNPIGILIIAIAGLIAILGYLYFNNGTLVLSSAGVEDGIMINIYAKADDYCEMTVTVNGAFATQTISQEEFMKYSFLIRKCNKANIEISVDGECLVDKIEICKEEIIDKGKAMLCLDAETTANLPSGPLSVNGAIMVNGKSYGLATTQIGTVNKLPKITIN